MLPHRSNVGQRLGAAKAREIREILFQAIANGSVVSLQHITCWANTIFRTKSSRIASWEGLRHLGLNPPVAWDPFRGQSSEREFAIALSEPEEELIMILLVRVAGVEIPGGLYVYVPSYFKGALSRPYCLPSRELYKWVVPQLEYAAITQGIPLPDAYSDPSSTNWGFVSKLDD
jgi:hypothetical protein